MVGSSTKVEQHQLAIAEAVVYLPFPIYIGATEN